MKLTLIHAGQKRTLVKHPTVQRDLRAGAITEKVAATKSWYLRFEVAGKTRTFKLPAANSKAVRAAKEILRGQQERPSEFSAFLDAQAARHSITVGKLADEWFAAGLPFRKTEPRLPVAAARLRDTLERALPWWKDKPVSTITANTVEDFAAHRAPSLRAADLELGSVSSLCQWAVLAGRIEKNPLEKRPKFAKVKAHCHEACPDDDEALHCVLAYLFKPAGDPLLKLAGGTMAFCALSGLRPGEPALLLRLPVLEEMPNNTRNLEPGVMFRDREGVLRMKVQRLKHGQNPFVTLHPAAQSFMSAWRVWLAATMPDVARLFPLGTEDHTALNRALNAASAALGLPHYKPHGFGRAFYVKVRRSQGTDDATIAGELGQTTNGELIRSVYGDPQDLHGGALFDWVPDDAAPSWNLLAMPPTGPAMEQPDRGLHLASAGSLDS